jgi:hypothetical protein
MVSTMCFLPRAALAWIGAGGTGAIFQTLAVTLRANATYTLRLSVGNRADQASFTGYVATLLAGSVPIAFDDSLAPAPGTFLQDVIVFKSGPNTSSVSTLETRASILERFPDLQVLLRPNLFFR